MKILILTFLLMTGAATAQNITIATNITHPFPAGTHFVLDANQMLVPQTNLVAVPVAPVVDKFQLLMDRLIAGVAAFSTLIAALALWWGKNRDTIAKILPLLVKKIALHGSDLLKSEIKDAAGDAGLQPALDKIVKANVTEAPKPTVITAAFQAPPADPPKIT